MSVLAATCDAVVSVLNGATFDPTFTAETRMRPIYRIGANGPEPVGDELDCATLRVIVSPRSRASELVGRNALRQSDVAVAVEIAKRVTAGSDDDTVELMGLMDAIDAALATETVLVLNSGAPATWRGSELEMPFVPEYLEQDGLFLSSLLVTYSMVRTGV